MSTLAEYLTEIALLLDDDGNSRYSTSVLTSALRAALQEYSHYRPPLVSVSVAGNGTYKVTLAFPSQRILRIELQDFSAINQLVLPFIAEFSNNSWNIKFLNRKTLVSDILIVYHLGIKHTIDDLDSAASTTVLPQDEAWLQMGAAGYAAMARSASQGEANVINADATTHLYEIANKYLTDFRNYLLLNPGNVFGQTPIISTEI